MYQLTAFSYLHWFGSSNMLCLIFISFLAHLLPPPPTSTFRRTANKHRHNFLCLHSAMMRCVQLPVITTCLVRQHYKSTPSLTTWCGHWLHLPPKKGTSLCLAGVRWATTIGKRNKGFASYSTNKKNDRFLECTDRKSVSKCVVLFWRLFSVPEMLIVSEW